MRHIGILAFCQENKENARKERTVLKYVFFRNKDAPKGPGINPGPKGWTSFGCWSDSPNPRTLAKGTATPGGASNMSVALCTTACSAAGYSLAGVGKLRARAWSGGIWNADL